MTIVKWNHKQTTILAAILLALGLVVAIPLSLPQGASEAIAQDEDVNPLEDIMGTISSRHKRLRRTITDASKNADSLKYLLEMQAAVIKAKAQKPSMAAKIPESQRAKFIIAYRKGLNVLLASLVKIEEALLDGKQKAAQETYAKLLEIKKASHEKFIEQE